jgi:aspartate kinase
MKAFRDYIDRHKVAIVCSARSGSTKALGTTNLLLKASSEALYRKSSSNASSTGYITPNYKGPFSGLPSKSHSPDGDSSHSPSGRSRSQSSNGPVSPFSSPFSSLGFSSITDEQVSTFSATVDVIRSEHVNAARENVRDPELLKALEVELERDCDALRSFLFAAQVGLLEPLVDPNLQQMQVIDEISPRSKDTIIGFGERLACKLMATILRDRVRSLHLIATLKLIVLSGRRCRICVPRVNGARIRRRLGLQPRLAWSRIL